MNKNSSFFEYEIQIKCPSKKSYQSHISLMNEIISISQIHNIDQKLIDTDPDKFLITWLVKFSNAQDQTKATIESMALLSKNYVVPGELIYQKEIKGCTKNRKKVEKVIDLIDEELYGQTA